MCKPLKHHVHQNLRNHQASAAGTDQILTFGQFLEQTQVFQVKIHHLL